MKIAVTAEGPTLESQVDERFGRCPYFLIVDPADMSFEPIANPFIERQGGAGIQAGKLMAERGVQAVLTGHCGVNATDTLGAAGIRIVPDCAGTVRQAIERFKKEPAAAGAPTAATPPGPASVGNSGGFVASVAAGLGAMGMGRGWRGGRNGGRGRGGGGGRGMRCDGTRRRLRLGW